MSSSTTPRISYLDRQETPYEALCHHFNVEPPNVALDAVPETFDMIVTQDGPLPTHVIAAIFQSRGDSTPPMPNPPMMLPVDVALYDQCFDTGLTAPDSTPAATRSTNSSGQQVITLPVVPLEFTHLSSLPYVLLFGLGLESQTNHLVLRMLPSQVIEEFPNADIMSKILARCRTEQFEQVLRFNQGLWRNLLALGMKDNKLAELVSTAWSVTAEARKIRQRAGLAPMTAARR